MTDPEARPDATIEDRRSLAAEDSMASLRNLGIASRAERVLALGRRSPVLAITAAAGAGWLLYRLFQIGSRNQRRHGGDGAAEDIRVLNTGQARIYDPDASSLHPTQDSLQSRRDISARV
jgi:hypothetical protein